MCRLFGFRASAPSQVHRALVLETNALSAQSQAHPDGWGIAFYVAGQPEVARGVDSAFRDEDFENLSQFVQSETVVAHVRKASVGRLSLENTHPFVHGPWVFAHNGTVPNFERIRAGLEDAIAPAHRAAILGDTDSERLFRLYLSELERDGADRDPPLSKVFEAIRRTLNRVLAASRAIGDEPSLNVVVTNGRLLAASRHGRTLHFSTHKHRCPERTTCRGFAERCEKAVGAGDVVSHFIVASEQIGGVDVWQELADGDLVGVDDGMRLRRERLDPPLLRALA